MVRQKSVTSPNLPSASASSSHEAENNSTEETPRSSSQPSPTINLTREYTLAVQTFSYNEIWSKIHSHDNNPEDQGDELQVLQPNRESVEDALRCAKPSALIRLVSSYFDSSEDTSHLCLNIHQRVNLARSLYAPLHDLFEILPLHSLSQSQCEFAFNVFLQFDRLDNPFLHPESSSNFQDMRSSFSDLKEQLDRHLHKSHRKLRLSGHITKGSALCLIGTSIGVAISAVAIAAHALVAIVAGSFFIFIPTNCTKKEHQHIAQLDAAAMGTFVLNSHLYTIDRLVVRLHDAVESDRHLIRLSVERGMDKYLIEEVLKQLRKNYPNFNHQLKDLEEHVCLCFTSINRARSLLLREIHLHNTA